MAANFREMSMQITAILCLVASHHGFPGKEDQAGCEALFGAGLFLVAMMDTQLDEYDPREDYDKDELVRDLSAYFEYLHGLRMDFLTRNSILNAIRYIQGMEWEDALQLEMACKKLGWAREEHTND